MLTGSQPTASDADASFLLRLQLKFCYQQTASNTKQWKCTFVGEYSKFAVSVLVVPRSTLFGF